MVTTKTEGADMKKTILILIVVIAGLGLASCFFGPEAPLEDGLYLTYDCGDETTLSVTFEEISSNKFRATVTPGNSQKVVDKQLKTKLGAVYEIDLLGPLWIPPGSVKVGGNAHGDNVTEVMHWEGWDVGVVEASFGTGGALRGEWYYEKTTGFLVGGSKTTAFSDEGEGLHFVLAESNLDDL
jgi:hypothetical protein